MIRRTTQNRLREYAIAAVLALVIIWLISLIWSIARKEEIARGTVKETQAELTQTKEREAILEANLAELNTDRGQEATLRQTFGVAKPGEEVIIVVPEKETTAPPPVHWWNKVLGWFGL
jgi:cell division protein FtsB